MNRNSNLWLPAFVLSALALLLLGALDSPRNPGSCKRYVVDDDFDDYIASGGRAVVLEFEPDEGSATSTARVSLEACSAEDTDSCTTLNFDSDYDGVPDTNILTGAGGARGTAPIRTAGLIRVWSSTNPSGSETGAVVLLACSVF